MKNIVHAIASLRVHRQQIDDDGIMVGVSRQALDEVLSALDELCNTIAEANRELRCCDDINLDKGVAAGIAELQTDRERAWARERKLRVALEGLRHWADQFTPAPAYVSGFCELIIDVDALLWGDAQLEPPGPSCDRCMGPALGDRCLDHRSGMRTCDLCAGRLSDRDLGGPCEECGAPVGDLHAANCPVPAAIAKATDPDRLNKMGRG